MTQTIRVLIADDHPLMLRGIHETLSRADDMTPVGEAARGEDAQRLCAELRPDVLLLDLQMPGGTAVETMRFVREHCPQTRIIILTAYDDEIYVRRMIAEGAVGYVLKDEASESVPTAIRSAVQGGIWLSRSVLRMLMAHQPCLQTETEKSPLYTRAGQVVAELYTPCPLTRQQRKVLRLVEEGLTNDEVAARLFLSPKTIKKHLVDIHKRLGVHDRESAARAARDRGYLD